MDKRDKNNGTSFGNLSKFLFKGKWEEKDGAKWVFFDDKKHDFHEKEKDTKEINHGEVIREEKKTEEKLPEKAEKVSITDLGKKRGGTRYGTVSSDLSDALIFFDGEIPGDTILAGRYKILSFHKKMDEKNLYIAEDTRLDKECIVKELRNDFTSEEENYYCEKFKEEAKICSGLVHPNIPITIDYFIESGRHFIVTEFIKGFELQTIIENHVTEFTEENVIMWAINICDGLIYLHNNEPAIANCGITPEHILINERNLTAFLTNFNICEKITEKKIKNIYTAPEILAGKYGPESDIYSLGAILYHLVTFTEPIISKIKPVKELNSGISEYTASIIEKAIKEEPSMRFKTPEEMKESLVKAMEMVSCDTDYEKPLYKLEDLLHREIKEHIHEKIRTNDTVILENNDTVILKNLEIPKEYITGILSDTVLLSEREIREYHLKEEKKHSITKKDFRTFPYETGYKENTVRIRDINKEEDYRLPIFYGDDIPEIWEDSNDMEVKIVENTHKPPVFNINEFRGENINELIKMKNIRPVEKETISSLPEFKKETMGKIPSVDKETSNQIIIDTFISELLEKMKENPKKKSEIISSFVDKITPMEMKREKKNEVINSFIDKLVIIENELEEKDHSKPLNCWEFTVCGKERFCPAYPNRGRRCAHIVGNIEGKTSRRPQGCNNNCSDCNFYNSKHYIQEEKSPQKNFFNKNYILSPKSGIMSFSVPKEEKYKNRYENLEQFAEDQKQENAILKQEVERLKKELEKAKRNY